MDSVLKVEGLRVEFGGVAVVDDVGFDVKRGEIFGIVGGSGSGKTMTALSIPGILPHPGKITSGSIIFNGHDLVGKGEVYLRGLRGAKVSMVFQEPSTAFNPVFTIGYQLVEAILAHNNLKKHEAEKRAHAYLEKAHIRDARRVFREYPHRLSGGIKQRAMIAMALVNSPELVILDEPTSSLDVTVQAQVLGLIKELIRSEATSAIFISHDFGIISRMCDRVGVMDSGRLVESGDTEEVLTNPKDRYTISLLESVKALA